MTEPRTYTGWKAALLAIAATALLIAAANILGDRYAPKHDPGPQPTVVSVTPSAR